MLQYFRFGHNQSFKLFFNLALRMNNFQAKTCKSLWRYSFGWKRIPFFFCVLVVCLFFFFISCCVTSQYNLSIQGTIISLPGTIEPDKRCIAMVTPRIQRRIITSVQHGRGRERIECLTLSQWKICERSLGYA